MSDLRTTIREALRADDRHLFLDPDDLDAMADAVVAALPQPTSEVLKDLVERVEHAETILAGLRDEARHPDEQVRLGGKREGVQLVRSYIGDLL